MLDSMAVIDVSGHASASVLGERCVCVCGVCSVCGRVVCVGSSVAFVAGVAVWSLSLSLSLSLCLSLARSRSLSVTRPLSLALALSFSLSLARSRARALSLSLALFGSRSRAL